MGRIRHTFHGLVIGSGVFKFSVSSGQELIKTD